MTTIFDKNMNYEGKPATKGFYEDISMKEKYLLVIQIPFEAHDDIEARKIAKDYFVEHKLDNDSFKIKLQKQMKNKAPLGLKI